MAAVHQPGFFSCMADMMLVNHIAINPIGFSWLLGEFSVELTELHQLHQLSPQVASMWRVALTVFGTWLLRRSMIPGAGRNCRNGVFGETKGVFPPKKGENR